MQSSNVTSLQIVRDSMLERPLPHSEHAEQAILGAIILDNALIYQAIELGLEHQDFYVRAFAFVYDAMIEIAQTGGPIHPISLGEQLRKMGRLEQTGGIAFISELTYGLPHFTNIAAYAHMLKGKSALRQLIRFANKVTVMALQEEDEAEIIVRESEEMMLALSNEVLRSNKNGRKRDFVNRSEDKEEFRAYLMKMNRGECVGLPTGIKPIDNMLDGGGLQPQGFYLVSARPKAGKTSLALGIAERAAQRFEVLNIPGCVGVISMEMRRLALHMRTFSAYIGVPYIDMSRPGFRGTAFDVAMASLDEFFDSGRMYVSDSVFSLDEIWHISNRLVNGPAQAGLIVLDYLQIAELRRGRATDPDRRTAEVTAISRQVKHMAQDLNVPILGISSESRAGELRESGQLDYDTEALVRLENPAWTPKLTPEQVAALNREKVWDIDANIVYQRNGPTGPVRLKFLRPYMQFVTPEEYAAMLAVPKRGPANDDGEALWNSTKCP